MKKSIFVVFSLIITATMLLTACGASPTTAPATVAPATEAPTAVPPTATTAPVKITIWHQWDGAYLDAITKVFNQYMTDHPNVTIDLSKPNDVTASLKVAIPAGQGPDILAWTNDQIGSNAIAGNIVPLDDQGITQDFLTSTYEPAAVNGVVWQGKIWALPESQEAIALVYNKDLVTADYLPTDPMNFTDLTAKAEKFYADKHIPLLCNQGFKGGDAYHIAPVFFGFGVKQYVDDQGNVTVNTPEALNAMTWLLDIKTKGHLLQDADDAACRTAFESGKVGMDWTGPWAIADFDKANVNYGIVPMGKPFVGIKALMLTKNAVDRGNAAVALDIIKYYTNAQNEIAVALANKTIPANSAALKDPGVQALSTLAGFGASANLGVPMANTPYANAQWGPVGDAVGAIWSGKQKPADALAAAQKAIEDAVAQMK
ncbi:MAG TPA: extracellular solute-binding protein [Anaerolineales bacterium]|nr:extracellular solute-binding protein [Anaerolineales bacterium]